MKTSEKNFGLAVGP